MASSYKQKVIYQAYPKSFYDTDGNGVGDIKGITAKIPYIAELGAEMVWLNPFFPSPQKDNGYDVSDYCAINPDFGTMADFEEMVAVGKEHGIDFMLDMVFNHTSIEHEWFQKALAGDEKYQDYYIIRDAVEGQEFPTNWESKFVGPAWNQFGDTDKFFLCLYDKTQADLNWRNPEVRDEMAKIVNFWLEKGVKGFRFDVLNVIGKDEELVNSTGGASQEKALYTDKPIVHEYIQGLNVASFGKVENVITVGEMSSTTIESSIGYTNPDNHELTMVFSFHHLKVDYLDGEKWSLKPFDFIELKSILNDWQVGMSDHNGWNALFWNNHDQPRALSRFGDDVNYREKSATSQAHAIHFLRGTPYVYQGEEIGMTNPYFKKIDQYVDVESHNAFNDLIENGTSEAIALEILADKSRDNSRTPMQWDASENAGFTKGTPWIQVADNYKEINVEKEIAEGEIFPYYQQLIALRKDNAVISDGDYYPMLFDHPQIFAYGRKHGDEELITFVNFYGNEVQVDVSGIVDNSEWTYFLGNYGEKPYGPYLTLEPYEAISFIK